jgi:hypothetical protein
VLDVFGIAAKDRAGISALSDELLDSITKRTEHSNIEIRLLEKLLTTRFSVIVSAVSRRVLGPARVPSNGRCDRRLRSVSVRRVPRLHRASARGRGWRKVEL